MVACLQILHVVRTLQQSQLRERADLDMVTLAVEMADMGYEAAAQDLLPDSCSFPGLHPECIVLWGGPGCTEHPDLFICFQH